MKFSRRLFLGALAALGISQAAGQGVSVSVSVGSLVNTLTIPIPGIAGIISIDATSTSTITTTLTSLDPSTIFFTSSATISLSSTVLPTTTLPSSITVTIPTVTTVSTNGISIQISNGITNHVQVGGVDVRATFAVQQVPCFNGGCACAPFCPPGILAVGSIPALHQPTAACPAPAPVCQCQAPQTRILGSQCCTTYAVCNHACDCNLPTGGAAVIQVNGGGANVQDVVSQVSSSLASQTSATQRSASSSASVAAQRNSAEDHGVNSVFTALFAFLMAAIGLAV